MMTNSCSGTRLYTDSISSLGLVVKYREALQRRGVCGLIGPRQLSHRPAEAHGSQEASAKANGCLVLPSRRCHLKKAPEGARPRRFISASRKAGLATAKPSRSDSIQLLEWFIGSAVEYFTCFIQMFDFTLPTPAIFANEFTQNSRNSSRSRATTRST